MSYSLTDLRRYVVHSKLKGLRVARSGARADEVQTLTKSTAGGASTGGTFTLTYSGQTTGTIAHNASAAVVQAALEALSNIAVGDVTVTGTGPWVVTFGGTLAGTDVAAITANASGITGPGSPYTITVAETQKGGYVGIVASSNADQRRIVVSSDWLSQSIIGGEDSNVQPGAYDGASLFIPSTGEERRIAINGWTPSALASDITDQSLLTSQYVGYATVTRPFASVVPANVEIERHARMPVLDDSDRDLSGLHSIINRALSRMATPKRIAITAVSGQEAYTLAAYLWLTRQDQLIRALAYESVSLVENVPMSGDNRIRIDGQTAYFTTNGAPTAGQSFYLDVWRPRSTWIKVGGTWQDSTAGLVNETDEADVDPSELAIVAYYFACDELAEHGPDAERGMWATRRERAEATAAPFLRWQRERYDDPTDVATTRSDAFGSILSSSSVGSWP